MFFMQTSEIFEINSCVFCLRNFEIEVIITDLDS